MAENIAKRYEILGPSLVGFDYVPVPHPACDAAKTLHPDPGKSVDFVSLFQDASRSINQARSQAIEQPLPAAAPAEAQE